MSYKFKLLELIEPNNGHVKIRISIDQDEKLFWLKLDTVTYESLSRAYNQLEGSLMRLSFMANRDPFTGNFSSTLTAIKGYDQRKLDFNCSELYTQKLEQMKEAHSFKEIEEFSFIELPENMVEESKNNVNDFEVESKKPHAEVNLSEPDAKATAQTEVHDVESNEDREDVESQKEWASFKVDDVVEHEETTGWLHALPYNKVFQKGLIVAVALALILAFSNEHFFATESDPTEFNEEDYLDSTSMDLTEIENKAQTESDKVNVQGVQVIESQHDFPMYEVSKDVFYGLPEGYVALTFDDGPSFFTKDIADVLAKHEVAGTFFFVGTQIEKYPEYVSYVEGQGHVVGNHSHHHHNLNELTPSILKNEILESITGLEGLVGKQVELFRPPYGAAEPEVIEVLKQQDLKTVMWNRDPRDWEANSKNEILNYFKSVDSSGGIYILHENKHTLKALPEILAYLESEGLQVVGLQ